MSDENTFDTLTKLKVKAALSVLKIVRPGITANALASFCIFLLKKLAIRADVARQNIALCFPEKSEEEREKILSESYESMIWTAVELLGWQHDPSLIDRMVCEIKDIGHIEKVLGEGRGAILLCSHHSNWEFTAAYVARHFPIYAIAQHSENKFQRLLIQTLRESSGIKIISKDAPMKQVITLLKNNCIIGIVGDQHAGHTGIPAPFFGEITQTAQGPAIFSILTGAPILPFITKRIEPFKFSIEICERLPMPPKTMKRSEAALFLTAKVNEAFEKEIRSSPGQYLWQHKRFKEKFNGFVPKIKKAKEE